MSVPLVSFGVSWHPPSKYCLSIWERLIIKLYSIIMYYIVTYSDNWMVNVPDVSQLEHPTYGGQGFLVKHLQEDPTLWP